MMDGPAMERMMASQGQEGMRRMMQTPAMQRMHAEMTAAMTPGTPS